MVSFQILAAAAAVIVCLAVMLEGATTSDSTPSPPLEVKVKAAHRFFGEPAPAVTGEKKPTTWRQRLMADASNPSGFSAPYYSPKNYTVTDFYLLVEGFNSDFHKEMESMEQQNQKMSSNYIDLEKRLNENEKRIQQLEEQLLKGNTTIYYYQQPQFILTAAVCLVVLMAVMGCVFFYTKRMLPLAGKNSSMLGKRNNKSDALIKNI